MLRNMVKFSIHTKRNWSENFRISNFNKKRKSIKNKLKK